MHILIIEDNEEIATHIINNLIENGHQADHALRGDEGVEIAMSGNYDVLIVDRMLPGMDGLDLIRRLREQGNQTPTLILSSLGDTDNRVLGLNAGGDDYLTKPFAFSELLARIHALNRRNHSQTQETTLVVGNLKMDLLTREVWRNEKLIELEPRSFSLLECFMRHSNQIVTREMLLLHVWDYKFDPQTNVVDVHVSRLRSKIDKDFDDQMLLTIRGVGWTLSDAKC
ncbi:MAG: response regulator transcription factor [Gammaproteobacteria bacterium]|nr:response regulator transcription factor [Gammaproteobacteria bacterium]MCY4218684.1 response regulator transcription factor [Gammaproteobacteria bacterium]MCY4273831.1 response regulator transcription factor [Gammaproteobacteria bacterium]